MCFGQCRISSCTLACTTSNSYRGERRSNGGDPQKDDARQERVGINCQQLLPWKSQRQTDRVGAAFFPCSCKGAVQHPNCFTCRDRGLICQAGAPRNFQILTGRLIWFRLMPVCRRLVDLGGSSGLKFTSLGTHLPQLLSGRQGKLRLA
jgi:hypothetical protein